jgi:hypothetical protein
MSTAEQDKRDAELREQARLASQKLRDEDDARRKKIREDEAANAAEVKKQREEAIAKEPDIIVNSELNPMNYYLKPTPTDPEACARIIGWMDSQKGDLEKIGIDNQKIMKLKFKGNKKDAAVELEIEGLIYRKAKKMLVILNKLKLCAPPSASASVTALNEIVRKLIVSYQPRKANIVLEGGASKKDKVHMTGAGLLALTIAMAFVGSV